MVLVYHGKVAGISGIFGGLLTPRPGDLLWRAMFVLGLVLGGAAIFLVEPAAFARDISRSHAAVGLAGVLVGVGTRMGSGCTSGHGICGISRLSARSLVATCTFMLTAAATVLVVNRVLGGAL